MHDDERAVALFGRQEALDRIEVLEAEARRDRRRAVACSVCLACALGLGLVSPAWVLAGGYPAWALSDLRAKARKRGAEMEELGQAACE